MGSCTWALLLLFLLLYGDVAARSTAIFLDDEGSFSGATEIPVVSTETSPYTDTTSFTEMASGLSPTTEETSSGDTPTPETSTNSGTSFPTSATTGPVTTSLHRCPSPPSSPQFPRSAPTPGCPLRHPPTSALPAVVCQNGGTYDGIKCICHSDFYGPACEYFSDSITTDISTEGTIVANVELVVTVTNFVYTEELQDPLSEVYESFAKHFQQEMAKIYGSLTGYEGVKIINIRPAASSRRGARVRRASASSPVGTGLEVEHEVIFSTVASPDLSEEFQNKTQELVAKLQETASNQGDCEQDTSVVCLAVSSSPILKGMTESSSFDALCQQRAPIGYQDYYYALTTSSTLRCVTNCTANTPSTINCNHGECHVTRAGPQCFCQDESLYWYTGSQCSGRVSKVATGLGVAVTVLLVACITLTVLLVIWRKGRKRNTSASVDENWYEDDGSTWTASDGFVLKNKNATEPGGSLKSFTASLERVNTDIPMQITRPSLRPRL
ncbi:mucin-3A-like [Mergus octosetaceus]